MIGGGWGPSSAGGGAAGVWWSILHTVAIAGYRSLRELVVSLGPLTVVTGPNGSGKSSLYRALRLLADTASGDLVGSLAREGGLASARWAGPEQISRGMRSGTHRVEPLVRKGPVSVRLGFAADDLSFALDLGLPATDPGRTAFALDPEIKREVVWAGPVYRRAAVLVDRDGPLVAGATDRDGVLATTLPPWESMLTACADPRGAPELLVLRDRLRGWRFYDTLRTDRDAPARVPRVGTRTLRLAHDGADLAAAWQTIAEIGDAEALAAAVDDAFPGSRVQVVPGGQLEIRLAQPGLLRPLAAAELSDGTLRYLLWVAALLSPRPPELLVLNEPETSLHPDLVPALARRVVEASSSAQVVVVTHSAPLVAALERAPGVASIRLEKDLGETRVAGQDLLERPAWKWPKR